MIPRQAPRIAIQLPVEFSGDREGLGVIHDLSVNGCRIASSTIVEVGQCLSLLLHPGDDKPPIAVEMAHVRWASAWEFGVAFESLHADEQDRLLLFITTLASA